MIKILSENLKIILIGLISILMIIAIAIVLSLYFGGDVSRQPTITDIKGSASIERNHKHYNADKNIKLKSGDIVTTGNESSIRISIDDDKFVVVEPNSSVYIYFTDVASKGDISVNLTKGAVICQLDKKLQKGATFDLKTPNSCISVTGTVFRTTFDYKSEYMGYKNVMITEVQNFDGSVNLQLYDFQKQPKDLPMVLIERTAAQMITAENLCQYGYLNYSFTLDTLSDITLGELIRANSTSKLAFTNEEINLAYKAAVDEKRRLETMTETTVTETEETTTVKTTTAGTPKTTSETSETNVTTESTTTSATTVTTKTETQVPTSYDTLRTTRKTYEYTTYSGIKWWELTGNTNTDTDDYEDWFTEKEDDDDETIETTVTAGTSAQN